MAAVLSRSSGRASGPLYTWTRMVVKWWSISGQLVVKYLVDSGQLVGGSAGRGTADGSLPVEYRWSNRSGQKAVVKYWSNTGQMLVKYLVKQAAVGPRVIERSYSGQILVKYWSNGGQIVVKDWSNAGQIPRRAGSRRSTSHIAVI